MTKTGWVFAGVLSVLPCIVGCTSEGGMDPNISNAISNVVKAGGENSQEAQAFSGGMKFLEGATLSDARAKQIGEATAVAIINQPQYKVSADDKLNAYVTKVGLTVAAVSPRPDIQYTFGVLESTTPNALSMPGGYIFITRGALQRMQDESELAGVLAHEVGHICKDHGKNQLRDSKMLEGGTQILTSADEVQQFKSFVQDFSKQVLKPWGQGAENDADKEAVAILKRAGYDPMGLARYLNRVSDGKQSGGLNFSTHPITADRVKKIQTYAAGASGAVLKERFAANVK